MDQHTRGKWLIHGPKHCKDNHWQSLKHPSRYPIWGEWVIKFNDIFHADVLKESLMSQEHHGVSNRQ